MGRPAYVKPGLIMLTADQAAARGIEVQPAPDSPHRPLPDARDVAVGKDELAPLSTAAVVGAPDIKVYTVSRSVDAADPELMHEEHVVYRRETAPRWKLNAPAAEKILVGPRVTDGRQEIQPVSDKELVSFLEDQRRAAEANQKAIAALFQAVDTLSKQEQELARHALGRNAEGPRRESAAPADGSAPPASDAMTGEDPRG